jgi:hypothetical protein
MRGTDLRQMPLIAEVVVVRHIGRVHSPVSLGELHEWVPSQRLGFRRIYDMQPTAADPVRPAVRGCCGVKLSHVHAVFRHDDDTLRQAGRRKQRQQQPEQKLHLRASPRR